MKKILASVFLATLTLSLFGQVKQSGWTGTTNPATARSSLGLGTAATHDVGDFPTTNTLIANATTSATATNARQLLDAAGNVITHSIITSYITNTVAALDYSRIWGTNPAAPMYGGNGWSYTNSGGYFTNAALFVIGYTNSDAAWENGPMPFSSLNVDNTGPDHYILASAPANVLALQNAAWSPNNVLGTYYTFFFTNLVTIITTNVVSSYTGTASQATNATTATTAVMATNTPNTVIICSGSQMSQPWFYDDFSTNKFYVGPIASLGVIASSGRPKCSWTVGQTGGAVINNQEYIPYVYNVRANLTLNTNLPVSGTNAAGWALVVYGRVPRYSITSDTADYGDGAGLKFGFSTNASYVLTIGGSYATGCGMYLFSPSGRTYSYEDWWFTPDTEIGLCTELLTNGFCLKIQGGNFDDQGCVLGSQNWFEIYRYQTNNANWLTNLAAYVGAEWYNGIAISRVEIYSNWVDSGSASLVYDGMDYYCKAHVPDIIYDTFGNHVCSFESHSYTNGDSGPVSQTWLSIQAANGMWSSPTLVAGSATNAVYSTATNAACLSMLNGQLVVLFQHTTGNYVTNYFTSYKAVYITNGAITLGAQQEFNVTNLSALVPTLLSATNIAICSPIITAPDGYSAVFAPMLNTNGQEKFAYCLRCAPNDTNWCAYQINNQDWGTDSQEGCLFIMSDGNLGAVERKVTGAAQWQSSTNSGLSWGAGLVCPWSASDMRPSACSLPGGQVAFVGADNPAQADNGRYMGCIWIAQVTVTNGIVLQSKIPTYGITNTYSFNYPRIIYHNGNLETVWAENFGAMYTICSGIHFNSQPLDQSWRIAAINAKKQALSRADRQGAPGPTNIPPSALTPQFSTNITVAGVGTFRFTNGVLGGFTP